MSTEAYLAPKPFPWWQTGQWALAIAAAVVLGATTTIDPTASAILAGALGLGLAASLRVAVVPAMLVLLAAFDSIIPQHTRFGDGIEAHQAHESLAAVLALIVVLAELGLGRSRILLKSPTGWVKGRIGWVGAYVLWAVASTLWTVSVEDSLQALWGLALITGCLLAFAALLSSRSDLRLLVSVVVLASLSVATYSIAAYATGAEGSTLVGTSDTNGFGLHQVMLLPLVFVAATHAPTRWLRAAIYVAALVVIGSIFTSLSRGSVVALVVLVLAMLFAPTGTVFRSRAQRVIPVLIAGAVLISATLLTNEFAERWVWNYEGEAAGSGRVNLWSIGVAVAYDRPVLGLGYGGFKPSSNELMRSTPGVDLARFPLTGNGLRAHSAYVSTVSELGLVGLALFLGLLIATAMALKRMARTAYETGDFFVSGVAYALILTLVGWAINSAFSAAEIDFLLWAVFGLSLALPKLVPDGTRDGARPIGPRQPAVGV